MVGSTDTDTGTKPKAEILTDADTDTSIGCSLVFFIVKLGLSSFLAYRLSH